MEKNLKFSDSQIKKINKSALAEKYECTEQYIGQVLRGEKGKNKKAKAIRKDAQAVLKIVGDPIMEIEVVDPIIVSA
tara:strand:- start:751 stop:981 length:231 start_codon:yes stop_codon:yes gene_type:complete